MNEYQRKVNEYYNNLITACALEDIEIDRLLEDLILGSAIKFALQTQKEV